MKIPSGQKAVLVIALAVEALAVLPPAMYAVDPYLPMWVKHLDLVWGPFAVVAWLMKAVASVYYIPIAVAVCCLILCGNISPRIKVVVAVAGGFAYFWLFHWAQRTTFS